MKLRRGAKLPFVILLPCIFCSRPAVSQSPPSDTTRADTVRNLRGDTLARPLISIPLLGSIDRSILPGQVIDDSARHFTEYEGLADLLAPIPGVWTFGLGSPGQFDGLTLQGLGARDIAILEGGILLNEPYSGTYRLNSYPVEDIDRVEVIAGTRSFLYALNGTAGTINLVERSKRAVHPYSHIRYSEDGYGYSLIDGTVSEDIIRGLNISAGAQHTTTDGRFPNSDLDAWSGRVRVRYNFSNGVNLFGSETYGQMRLDLNGGIDSTTPENLRFDRIQATVRNTDSYEKDTRHDVRLGIAVNVPADSCAIHALTLYYSTNLREYRDEENRPGSNGIFFRQNQESHWYGLKATEHRSLANLGMDFGAEIQYQRVRVGVPGIDGSTIAPGEKSASRYDFFAKSDFRFLDALGASAYGRFDGIEDHHVVSFGADGTVSLAGGVEMFAGASRSNRFPTIQEIEGTSPAVSPLLTNDREEQRLLEAGLRVSLAGGQKLDLKAFHRTLDNPIEVVAQPSGGPSTPFAFSRVASVILRGIDGSATFRLGSFVLKGTAQYIGSPGSGDGQVEFPAWTGSGGAYFWDTLFHGHLNLKAGLQGSFFSSYPGRGFNEQALVDVPSAGVSLIDPSGTVDFLLIAHLGNAYVHFIWENLLDRHYIMRVFYPMPDRSIRFGITWHFLN